MAVSEAFGSRGQRLGTAQVLGIFIPRPKRLTRVVQVRTPSTPVSLCTTPPFPVHFWFLLVLPLPATPPKAAVRRVAQTDYARAAERTMAEKRR